MTHPFDYAGQIHDREKMIAILEARIDCHAGPGTATPACGACVSCLLRVIETLEREKAALTTRVSVLDGSACADAFEARAEKAEADLAAMTEQWKAELNHANAWMRKYQAAEAQVAAARAECAGLIGRPWSRWAGDAGRDVLRAMDEAAK